MGSASGLSPLRCQAIVWTNAGSLSIEFIGTNVSEIWIKILRLSFKKINLKMSSAKWRPFCIGLNVSIFGAKLIFQPMTTDCCLDRNTKKKKRKKKEKERMELESNYKHLLQCEKDFCRDWPQLFAKKITSNKLYLARFFLWTTWQLFAYLY